MGLRYVPLRTGKCERCHYADLACDLREGIQYDAISVNELRSAFERLGRQV
jgi:hypothetical protein